MSKGVITPSTNMMIVFRSRFCRIGSEVEELLKGGVAIFFGENVPSTLEPYCIVHRVEVLSPLEVGDIIRIGDSEMTITAIGEVANKNLLELYHLVIKNNALSIAELPGDVSVKGTLPGEVFIGEEMLVLRGRKF